MSDAISFWIAKFFADVLIALSLAAIVLTVYLLIAAPSIIRRARCKHQSYFENGQCHAICKACRKDLGFIGAIREKEKRAKQ